VPRPRARQNVLLELLYVIGLLGRENVCALKRGGVEIPSDFAGIIAEEFDAGGGWRQKLATELKDAGFDIDLNKLLPS
jgi:predicted nucleotide-binding protein